MNNIARIEVVGPKLSPTSSRWQVEPHLANLIEPQNYCDKVLQMFPNQGWIVFGIGTEGWAFAVDFLWNIVLPDWAGELLVNKSFFRRAKIAGQAFADIANWREVLPRAAYGKDVTEIRLRNGSVLTAPPEIGLWPHFSDVWYHLSYTKFCPIPSGSLVVDIGANVGVFSLYASRFARIVYALEPASSNYSRLVKNTSQVPSIIPLNCACAANDGRASLDISGSPVAFSLMTSSTATTKESIDVISLATLFERYKIDRCDFLKLDCEGAEFEIIWESHPSLLSGVRRIVLEYHDHLSNKYSHIDLLEKLKCLGFRATSYNPKGTYGMIAAIRP